MTPNPAPIGLLAPAAYLDTLVQALASLGLAPAFAVDPTQHPHAPDVGLEAVLVILSPAMEEALDPFEDLLYSGQAEALFDEAQGREGWDAAQWAAHLGPKAPHLLELCATAATGSGSNAAAALAKAPTPAPASTPADTAAPLLATPLVTQDEGVGDGAGGGDHASLDLGAMEFDMGDPAPAVQDAQAAPADASLPPGPQGPGEDALAGMDLGMDFTLDEPGPTRADPGENGGGTQNEDAKPGSSPAPASQDEGFSFDMSGFSQEPQDGQDTGTPSPPPHEQAAALEPDAGGGPGLGLELEAGPGQAPDAGSGGWRPGGGQAQDGPLPPPMALSLVDEDTPTQGQAPGSEPGAAMDTKPATAPASPAADAPVGLSLDLGVDLVDDTHASQDAPAAAMATEGMGLDLEAPTEGFVLILGGVGGPAAIREIISHLNERMPVPVIVHQPMPQGRYDVLAANLGKNAPLPVSNALEGQVLTGGEVWLLGEGLAPEMDENGKLKVGQGAPGQALILAGQTGSAVVVVSGASQELVFPAMEAMTLGAQMFGQEPDRAYDGVAIRALMDLGLVAASPTELGTHLAEHWGIVQPPGMALGA